MIPPQPISTLFPYTTLFRSIAISQYQDYVIRSQVSEGSSLADGIKTAVAEFVNNHGYFPAANSSAGVAAAASILGQYVSKVDIGTTAGTVQAYYGGAKANSAIPAPTILIDRESVL